MRGFFPFYWNGGGQQVYVAGEFSDWQPVYKLERSDELGVYATTIELEAGQKVSFKYVVDGEWQVDASQTVEADEQGNLNNVAFLTEENALKPTAAAQTEVPKGEEQAPIDASGANDTVEDASTEPVTTSEHHGADTSAAIGMAGAGVAAGAGAGAYIASSGPEASAEADATDKAVSAPEEAPASKTESEAVAATDDQAFEKPTMSSQAFKASHKREESMPGGFPEPSPVGSPNTSAAPGSTAIPEIGFVPLADSDADPATIQAAVEKQTATPASEPKLGDSGTTETHDSGNGNALAAGAAIAGGAAVVGGSAMYATDKEEPSTASVSNIASNDAAKETSDDPMALYSTYVSGLQTPKDVQGVDSSGKGNLAEGPDHLSHPEDAMEAKEEVVDQVKEQVPVVDESTAKESKDYGNGYKSAATAGAAGIAGATGAVFGSSSAKGKSAEAGDPPAESVEGPDNLEHPAEAVIAKEEVTEQIEDEVPKVESNSTTATSDQKSKDSSLKTAAAAAATAGAAGGITGAALTKGKETSQKSPTSPGEDVSSSVGLDKLPKDIQQAINETKNELEKIASYRAVEIAEASKLASQNLSSAPTFLKSSGKGIGVTAIGTTTNFTSGVAHTAKIVDKTESSDSSVSPEYRSGKIPSESVSALGLGEPDSSSPHYASLTSEEIVPGGHGYVASIKTADHRTIGTAVVTDSTVTTADGLGLGVEHITSLTSKKPTDTGASTLKSQEANAPKPTSANTGSEAPPVNTAAASSTNANISKPETPKKKKKGFLHKLKKLLD